MKKKHADLQDVAIGWLYSRGCSVFAKEVPTGNGVADALGVMTRNGKEIVYYVEAKASRSDLICLKQKAVYARAVGATMAWCWQHDPGLYKTLFADKSVDRTKGWESCEECKLVKDDQGDTGIDFYYVIVADGVRWDDVYPLFGIINENGKVVRKATRMRRTGDAKQLIINVAHVLVYKAYGKLYGF